MLSWARTNIAEHWNLIKMHFHKSNIFNTMLNYYSLWFCKAFTQYEHISWKNVVIITLQSYWYFLSGTKSCIECDRKCYFFCVTWSQFPIPRIILAGWQMACFCTAANCLRLHTVLKLKCHYVSELPLYKQLALNRTGRPHISTHWQNALTSF